MSRPEFDRQLSQLSIETTDLANVIDGILDRALNGVANDDPVDARIALSQEERITSGTEAIEERVMRLLALQQPVLAADLRHIVGSLVVAQRLHRAGHSALGIARLAVDLDGLNGSERPSPALITLGQEARSMLRDAIHAFVAQDLGQAQSILDREKHLDIGYEAIRDQTLQDLSGTGLLEMPDEHYHRRLTFWLWIAHKIERIADHSVVIARRAIQLT